MTHRETHIVPAILPSSRTDFEEKLKWVSELPGVERIQIDVVDGDFAAPVSWPYTERGAGRQVALRSELLPNTERIAYEIDLMCHDVEQAADTWLTLGVTRLTLHAEAIIDIGKTIARIHARHGGNIIFHDAPFLSIGIALNTNTPMALIEPFLSHVSYVQFMGIDRIGRQAQPFNPRVVERIGAFRKKYPTLSVQIDGGVSLETIPALLSAGVSDFIVGSKIISAPDPASAFSALRKLVSLVP